MEVNIWKVRKKRKPVMRQPKGTHTMDPARGRDEYEGFYCPPEKETDVKNGKK